MQGRRTNVQFFPETLENSITADIHQSLQNNPADNSTQAQNVSQNFRARFEPSMGYRHRGLHPEESYGRWSSSEPPPINLNSYGGYETSDSGWMTSSSAYGRPSSIHSTSSGTQRASSSSSLSYSGVFVGDRIDSPSDEAAGYRCLDDRRHASKRKSLEGPSGQSSVSSSSAAPSRDLNRSESPSFNNTIAQNVEGFHGVSNSSHQLDRSSSQLWSPGNYMHSWVWPSDHYSSSSMNTFPHVIPNASPQQPPLPAVTSLPQIGYPMAWNGSSNYRFGSSTDLHLSSRRETNARVLERISILEHPGFATSAEMPHVVGPRDAGHVGISTFQPFSGVLPPLAPSWMPHQSIAGQTSSLFAAASRPAGDFRTSQQQLRSAFLMGRRSSVMAAPVTLHSRHARNMIIFEQIRNALELMQREESMMIDDVMIMDESEYADDYRDWRLDVDNMSYEELLALEERMGNVSTGLDEGTVLKNMKQSKYLSFAACKPESCCICQEEYEDGEDLGILSCGHDFHASCVGKWLVQKNICPICKIAALST